VQQLSVLIPVLDLDKINVLAKKKKFNTLLCDTYDEFTHREYRLPSTSTHISMGINRGGLREFNPIGPFQALLEIFHIYDLLYTFMQKVRLQIMYLIY
jgi:hypothetical protein